MTHLGFVATSYALGVGVPVALALSSVLRLSAARRTLQAIDPRGAFAADTAARSDR